MQRRVTSAATRDDKASAARPVIAKEYLLCVGLTDYMSIFKMAASLSMPDNVFEKLQLSFHTEVKRRHPCGDQVNLNNSVIIRQVRC